MVTKPEMLYQFNSSHVLFLSGLLEQLQLQSCSLLWTRGVTGEAIAHMYSILHLLVPASYTAIRQEIWAGAITTGLLVPMAELVWKPFKQYSEHKYICNKSADQYLLAAFGIYQRRLNTFFFPENWPASQVPHK